MLKLSTRLNVAFLVTKIVSQVVPLGLQHARSVRTNLAEHAEKSLDKAPRTDMV